MRLIHDPGHEMCYRVRELGGGWPGQPGGEGGHHGGQQDWPGQDQEGHREAGHFLVSN